MNSTNLKCSLRWGIFRCARVAHRVFAPRIQRARDGVLQAIGAGCDLPVAFNDPTGRSTAEATDLYTRKTTTTRHMVK